MANLKANLPTRHTALNGEGAPRAKRAFAIIAACLALCALCALAGCTGSKDVTFGAADAGGASFEATNETGQEITAVTVKSTYTETWPAALDQDGNWAKSGKATINVPASALDVTDEAQAFADAGLEDAPAVLVDIRVTLADGTKYDITCVEAQDVKDATLELSDDTAYMTYTSINSGESADTYTSQADYQQQLANLIAAQITAQAKAAQEDAAATDDAAAAVDDAAASEASTDTSVASTQATTSTSTNSSTSSSSSSSTSGASTGSNTSTSNTSSSADNSSSGSSSAADAAASASDAEEVCVDDLIFND